MLFVVKGNDKILYRNNIPSTKNFNNAFDVIEFDKKVEK